MFYVYIMASWSRCLYTGFTGDIVQRVGQHKGRVPRDPGFSSQYRTRRLVLLETTEDVHAAMAREVQIKGWRRSKKLDLITAMNPGWRDLAADWPHIEFPEVSPGPPHERVGDEVPRSPASPASSGRQPGERATRASDR